MAEEAQHIRHYKFIRPENKIYLKPLQSKGNYKMFNPDGTFSFYHEIMAVAEEFCEQWESQRGSIKTELEGALVFSFALNTIKYDLEVMISQLEKQPMFNGISPKEVLGSWTIWRKRSKEVG